jgi:hypothetical protein
LLEIWPDSRDKLVLYKYDDTVPIEQVYIETLQIYDKNLHRSLAASCRKINKATGYRYDDCNEQINIELQKYSYERRYQELTVSISQGNPKQPII